jgi:hypothetical protein
MKFEVNEDLAEVRLNAFFEGHKFASHSLTNDELEWVDVTEHEYTNDEVSTYIHAVVPQSEAEGLFEFVGSLDTYARQFFKETRTKNVWACNTCGAFTTDPTHRLITYFHANCQGEV